MEISGTTARYMERHSNTGNEGSLCRMRPTANDDDNVFGSRSGVGGEGVSG